MLKTIVAASMFAVLASSAANAQPSDYRTRFAFNQPVALPGVTLPPGTYMFRVANGRSSARVVQVLSADGSRSYALFATIPIQRPEAPVDPEVQFMETPEGIATAVRAWWYPGTATGYEFVYPRPQAEWLARRTDAPVLTTAADAGRMVRLEPSGNETHVN